MTDSILCQESHKTKINFVNFSPHLLKVKQTGETRNSEERKGRPERPKSASLLTSGYYKRNSKKRPRSSEPLLKSEIKSSSHERRKISCGKNLFEVRECSCWREGRRKSGFEGRCSSVWGFRGFEDEPWTCLRYGCPPLRKCKSTSNVFKTCTKVFDRGADVHKVKRSLRLLGFELSDFGIFPSRTEVTSRWKPDRKSPTFTTKITGRSVSLDSLRAAVKQAWMEESLDESHRRLLAKAAYEEWYFRKEQEIWEKREEERKARLKAKENIRNNFQRKKEKSEEEFQKWLRRKKMKGKENVGNLTPNRRDRLFNPIKTKEEREKAFLEWKKSKEKELERRKKGKRREEEKKMESEKQKNERKLVAEKAFEQWKTKLEEAERLKGIKEGRQRKKNEEEGRKKKEETARIPFETWKTIKEEQIRQNLKQMREMERVSREDRQTQMEERMYEAEQAFEEWLEKLESRKQKQFRGHNLYQKLIPWIPA